VLFIFALLVVTLSACGGDDLPYVSADTPTPYVTVTPVPTPYVPEVPSWEAALEEFLSELLPIFAPLTTEPDPWDVWDISGWREFVVDYSFEVVEGAEQMHLYIADPVTGERADADTPYVLARHSESEHQDITITHLANSFYLHDIDGDGIPTLLIRWMIPHGDRWGGVQMFRYIDGKYTPMHVLTESFWNLGEEIETPFLFEAGNFSGVSELFARDSEGRAMTLGIGGAGGVESHGYILHMDGDNAKLAPFFWIRFGWDGEPGEEMQGRIFVDESIVEEYTHLSDIDEIDALFFPWEWTRGGGDLTPRAIPILPDITVEPFPRMTELEQRLTERITARLIAEGRILP